MSAQVSVCQPPAPRQRQIIHGNCTNAGLRKSRPGKIEKPKRGQQAHGCKREGSQVFHGNPERIAEGFGRLVRAVIDMQLSVAAGIDNSTSQIPYGACGEGQDKIAWGTAANSLLTKAIRLPTGDYWKALGRHGDRSLSGTDIGGKTARTAGGYSAKTAGTCHDAADQQVEGSPSSLKGALPAGKNARLSRRRPCP